MDSSVSFVGLPPPPPLSSYPSPLSPPPSTHSPMSPGSNWSHDDNDADENDDDEIENDENDDDDDDDDVDNDDDGNSSYYGSDDEYYDSDEYDDEVSKVNEIIAAKVRHKKRKLIRPRHSKPRLSVWSYCESDKATEETEDILSRYSQNGTINSATTGGVVFEELVRETSVLLFEVCQMACYLGMGEPNPTPLLSTWNSDINISGETINENDEDDNDDDGVSFQTGEKKHKKRLSLQPDYSEIRHMSEATPFFQHDMDENITGGTMVNPLANQKRLSMLPSSNNNIPSSSSFTSSHASFKKETRDCVVSLGQLKEVSMQLTSSVMEEALRGLYPPKPPKDDKGRLRKFLTVLLTNVTVNEWLLIFLV
jgi:hypothetical protein